MSRREIEKTAQILDAGRLFRRHFGRVPWFRGGLIEGSKSNLALRRRVERRSWHIGFAHGVRRWVPQIPLCRPFGRIDRSSVSPNLLHGSANRIGSLAPAIHSGLGQQRKTVVVVDHLFRQRFNSPWTRIPLAALRKTSLRIGIGQAGIAVRTAPRRRDDVLQRKRRWSNAAGSLIAKMPGGVRRGRERCPALAAKPIPIRILLVTCWTKHPALPRSADALKFGCSRPGVCCCGRDGADVSRERPSVAREQHRSLSRFRPTLLAPPKPLATPAGNCNA